MKNPLKYIVTFGIVLLMASNAAKGQVLISLIFGDKLNTQDNYFGIHLNQSRNRISNFENGSDLLSFNLGSFFSHRLDENWMLNLELLAKYRRGMKSLPFYDLEDQHLNSLFQETTYSRSVSYFSLPITMRYFWTDRFFAEGGPQVSMRLKAWDIFTNNQNGEEIEYKRDIRGEITRVDFSYLVGIGYMVGKEKLNAFGLRYHSGISDILKNTNENQQHKQWSLYANLPIGRGKMKE